MSGLATLAGAGAGAGAGGGTGSLSSLAGSPPSTAASTPGVTAGGMTPSQLAAMLGQGGAGGGGHVGLLWIWNTAVMGWNPEVMQYLVVGNEPFYWGAT
jgi:hypothetical protein